MPSLIFHLSEMHTGENIETIINRLDEMRAELQTTYEETLKPMIEAELEAPKKQLADKAVIADILKLPDEDKAVGTDSMLQSPPPMAYDYMNGGLMAFKRRDIGSIFNYYRGMDSHPTFPKEVRSSPELNKNSSMFGTWSSSSYWSLPSKYGMPNLSHMCDEQSCDICNAEKYAQSSQACSSSDKIMIKETTNGLSNKPSHSEDIAASPKKSSSFSTYVQQLVDKYLPAETKSSVSQPSDLQKDFAVLDQGLHVAQSENDNVSSHIPHHAGTPFSRMISEKAPDGIKYPSEENKSNSISNGKSHFELSSAKSIENNQNQLTTRAKLKELDENQKFKTAHLSSPKSELRRQLDFRDVSNFNNTDNNHSHLLLHGSKSSLGEKKFDIQSGVEIQKPKISSSLNSIESKQSDIVDDGKLKTSNQEEPYNASLILSPESELKRQEIIRQLVFKNFKVNNNSNNQQSLSKSKSGALYSERELLPEEKNESPHVYHELSTIQEMDSAITAGSSQFSYSESYIEQKSPKRLEAKRKNSLEKSSESTDDIDTISLLDAPPSEVSELAKNIHFIPDASVKTAKYDLAKEDSKSSRKLSGAEEESNKLLIDVKTDENSSELTTLSPSLLSSNKASSSLVGSTDSPSFISHRESTPCFRPQKSLPEYFKDVSKIQHGELSPSERLLPSSSVSLSSSSVALSDVGINNKRERKVTENPEIEYNAPNHLYSTANKFQSLSSCSDISTPDVKKYENEVNKRNQYVNMYDEENAGSLDLNSVADKMTPRPFLQNTDNSRSFYPLRSCSKISTPESIDEQVTCLPRSDTRARSGGSFKPMSFTSDISTPAETVISKGSNSSDTSNSVNFMPMTLCFDISTPGSVKSKSSNSMTSNYVSIPQPHLQPANISKISCYVTLNSKSPLSKSEISHQSQNIHLQEMHPTRVLRNLPAFQSKLPNATSQTVMHIPGKNSYERARACTSGFFIPQILASDFSPPKSICSEIIEGTLYSTESLESVPAQNENICPSLLVSHGGGDCVKIPTIAVSTDCEKSDSKNQDDPNIKRFCSEDKSRTTIESNKASEECEQFNNADDAPVSHQEKKSCATNPFLTAGSLKNTPSCSSDENLSDCFSGSKITYQSTPIKTVEEIIQETGILEEPDLTLVNTMFSCGSILEKPRYHSELVSLKENLDHTLEDIEDTLPQKKSVTPNYSARIQATYVDSPSMISFLQHEMSCLAPKNDPCITENKTEGKKEKVREEYKKRTKRLWNNLEEVKKKNLIEEQKKRLVMNRLKVKEFSKKLSTPKKKNNK